MVVKVMKTLTVRVGDETYMELDSLCERRGYTKDALIKQLLLDFLEREKKEDDCFSPSHPFFELVGKFSSGVEDVSSNKYKYLAEAYESK